MLIIIRYHINNERQEVAIYLKSLLSSVPMKQTCAVVGSTTPEMLNSKWKIFPQP